MRETVQPPQLNSAFLIIIQMAEALRNHLILSFSEDRIRVGKGIWGRKAVLRPYPRSLKSEWEAKGLTRRVSGSICS